MGLRKQFEKILSDSDYEHGIYGELLGILNQQLLDAVCAESKHSYPMHRLPSAYPDDHDELPVYVPCGPCRICGKEEL